METVEPSENSQLDSDVEEPEILELMNRSEDCPPLHQIPQTASLSTRAESTRHTNKRMSWLRGEIEALRSFPERLMRPFRKIIRRKSSFEEVREESAGVPRVDEIIIPPPGNPFGSPSGRFSWFLYHSNLCRLFSGYNWKWSWDTTWVKIAHKCLHKLLRLETTVYDGCTGSNLRINGNGGCR